MCEGKENGNYEYRHGGESRENYYVSCSGGIAYCQPCFPLNLVFKEECNQCVYSMEGKRAIKLSDIRKVVNYVSSLEP